VLMQPELSTSRLLRRPFHISDAAEVQRLAGAREVAATTAGIPHPYPDGAAEIWFKTQEEERQEGTALVYAVCLKSSGVLLGAIGLKIDRESRHAEMGYWIGVPYWGHGYCTEAAEALLQQAFHGLELERVFARHFKLNPASGRVMEKLGMRCEGCLRRHYFKWGDYIDLVIYGILRSEWIERRQQAGNKRESL